MSPCPAASPPAGRNERGKSLRFSVAWRCARRRGQRSALSLPW